MRTRLTAFVVLSLLVLPAAAYAQASIVGTVRDASGAVLPGVTVEASSPALIEKTRSVVTNGVGQYSIEDLRPGTYAVTFTLLGFATVKREGIVLTGTFIATVNQDLKVGAVETITVTGEAPTVDVASARTEQTFSGQTIADIPSGRQYFSFTALVPAINVQGNDIGASSGAIFSVFQIHGGRRNEGQVQVNGMNAGYQGMGVSGFTPEVGNAQEVNVTLSGALAEAVTGGPQLNIISKQGGNSFSGSVFFTGANSSFQGENLSPELQAQGLTVSNALEKLWDLNPSLGGPIIRDRLWFFGSFRYQGNRQKINMFVNRNAGDPARWDYEPTSEQAIDDGTWKNSSGRLTWQATPRNKIDGWLNVQYNCQHCIQGGSRSGISFSGLVASPEGQTTNENHPSMLGQIGWSSPLTNRLLAEASWGIGPYFWWGSRQKNSWDKTLIPVQEDGGPIPGINYRSADWNDHTAFTNIYQGSLSYITGSHATKFGVRYHTNDSTFPKNYYNDAQVRYYFRDGAPYQVRMYADQGSDQHQHQGIFAFYAQDRWTIGRLSLQGGLRFEYLTDSFDRQQIGPNVFVPTAIVFEAQDGPLHQKDLLPRFGAAYDVFGNGKTAAKFFLGRYLTTPNTVDEWLNYSPAGAGRFISQQDRSWTDRNGNFVVDCNLLNPAAQGPTSTVVAIDDCGPGNPFFGQAVSPLTVDPATTDGWNTREHSWDLSASIVQEIMPRVSVEVGYIHRTWGNLQATVNRALTPADFDPFVYNVSQDSRLPNGGGYALTFYDINPSKFAQFDNYRTFTDNLGGASNSYNGVDVTVNARLRDVTVQGGFSTGNRLEDDCGVAAEHPDIYIFAAWGGSQPFLVDSPFVGGLGQWPQAFCRRESGWKTNVKGLASYTVPKIDVLVSGTFRSVPFAGADFPNIAGQSIGAQVIAAPEFETDLGRPLSSGSPIEFLNIVQPGVMYGDRLNSVDLRLGKNVRFSGMRTLVSLDIFNVANSNTPDVYQQSYGPTYRNPLSITPARLFKISVQFDF